VNLELISFKICPFVQRAVITLMHKGISHKVTYIDLATPPDWFKQLSPFGRVPLLKVNDKEVIFESAIIDEFLDESFPGTLLPIDPLQRAIDRSWIDFGSNLILDFSGLIHSTNEEQFNQKLNAVKSELEWLENRLGVGPFFNEETFSLVDIAYAPLFMRTKLLNLNETLFPNENYPKTAAWSEKLLAIPELEGSVVDDFETLLKRHIQNKAPYAATQMKL